MAKLAPELGLNLVEPLITMAESRLLLHKNARMPYPGYPVRFAVPDEFVAWYGIKQVGVLSKI